MRKSLLVLLTGLFIEGECQKLEYSWSNTFGSQSLYTEADFMAVDPHGNVYTVGSFSGTDDFDHGPGSAVLSNSTQAHYIRKTDSTGVFLWVKKFGGNTTQAITSMVADHSGNLYLCGSADAGIDLDPGQGNLALNTPSNNFIIKLDVNGDLTWSRIDSTKFSTSYQTLAVDAADNLYVTGYYMAGYDFDKGSGTYTLVDPPPGEKYVYVTKLSPAGNHVWSEAVCNQPQAFFITSSCADNNGNAYVSGSFADPLDLDPGSSNQQLTSAGSYDAVLIKVDSTGHFDWGKQTGGSGDDQGSSVTCDPNGNVILAGGFSGPVDFDPGAGVYTISTPSAGFIQKLSSLGIFLWAKDCPSWISSDQTDRRVITDLAGNIFIGGYLVGSSTIPTSTIAVSSQGDRDVILAKYKPDGSVAWAGTLGGEFVDQPYAIAAGPFGMIYVAGAFSSLYADLNPDSALVPASTGTAITSAFIVAFEQPCVNTLTVFPLDLTGLCPGDSLTLNAFGQGTVTWEYNGQSVGTGTSYITPPLQAGTHEFIVRDVTAYCSGGTGVTQSVLVPDCTGLNELSQSGTITIFPNPVEQIFHVKSSSVITLLRVYSITGQVVFESRPSAKAFTVDLSEYSPGVYLISGTIANGNLSCRRVVKQ